MKLDFFYSFNKFFVVFCPSEQIYDLFQIIFRIGTSAESLPHKEYGFQLALAQQQILPPCAGLLDVNRRKYPLFRQMPVKYKLHIAGSRPPERVRPLGVTVRLYALASLVMLSRRTITSSPPSTSRFARSMTISDTLLWFSGNSSNVE